MIRAFVTIASCLCWPRVSSGWICRSLPPHTFPSLLASTAFSEGILRQDKVGSRLTRQFASDRYWEEDEPSDRATRLDDYDFESDDSPSTGVDEDELEWEHMPTEDSGTAHVLLPPSSVNLPSCVVHFVGGTFFGSDPPLWYRALLEDIVRHTQAAVVATSIPVTLLNSPLEHVGLSKKIDRQFRHTWKKVLLDEYGEGILKVPVVGLGHSLGARLLVVLSTLDSPKRKSWSPPPYKSFILMSFINHYASAGIPGLGRLNRASRRVEGESKETDTRRRSRDEWRDYEDEDFDDDEDLGDIVEDLQDAIKDQASRIKNVFTPSSEKLEFHPTPDQLWKALVEGGRYSVPETLVVQFDDDRVDQSSKLAVSITGSSDVKFARLRGTHLTPVSTKGSEKRAWLDSINERVGPLMWKALAGHRPSSSSETSFRDLRQSIARYVTEIVTKD